jgi:hypothetical protein
MITKMLSTEEVAGKELLGIDRTTSVVDEAVKEQGQRYPYGRPTQGFAEFNNVRRSVKDPQIQGQ